MMDRAILLACLIETWQVTPNGCETQELDGFQSCTTARRRKYSDADEMIWPIFIVRRRAQPGKREARCSYPAYVYESTAAYRGVPATASSWSSSRTTTLPGTSSRRTPLRYRQTVRAKIKVRHQGDVGGKELGHGAARGRFCISPSHILRRRRPASTIMKS